MIVRLALILVAIASVGLSSGSATVYLAQEVAIDTLLGARVLASLAQCPAVRFLVCQRDLSATAGDAQVGHVPRRNAAPSPSYGGGFEPGQIWATAVLYDEPEPEP